MGRPLTSEDVVILSRAVRGAAYRHAPPEYREDAEQAVWLALVRRMPLWETDLPRPLLVWRVIQVARFTTMKHCARERRRGVKWAPRDVALTFHPVPPDLTSVPDVVDEGRALAGRALRTLRSTRRWTAVDFLAKHLGSSEEDVLAALYTLRDQGVAEERGSSWRHRYLRR